MTSAQSSTTILDHIPLSPKLERDIFTAERTTEIYGGDAPCESPSPAVDARSPTDTPPDANLVVWDGPEDQSNPQNWTRQYKWFITAICCIMTVNVTFASSAPSTASRMIAADFDVSAEVSYLITTTFLLGYVFGPLFWGPGSELFGRRPIFVVTMILYTIFHLGQALAPNIETLLVTRFLSGFFAVAPITNCGGVIADIWDAVGRGQATSVFTACVFIGPVLGPIVGGYIVDSALGWRWVFWVMMIFAGVCTLITVAALPESYTPVILAKKAEQIRKAGTEKAVYAEHEKQDWSVRGVIHRTIYRPFEMLFKEPILILVTVYISVIYGILYGLFEALPVIFIDKRGFTIAQVGLVFIGVGIGSTMGSIINVFTISHYPALIKKWKGFPPPEQRLFGAMIGGPLFVVGIFWLGWSGEYPSVPWYVPAISTILLGLSISMIFISFLSYLVDTYLMYSASVFAANVIVRSAVAAAFPLFTVQMFQGLGVNWAATLLGLIGVALVPIPFLFYKYGARVRAGSKFAPCIDLRIAKEIETEFWNRIITPIGSCTSIV